MNGIQQWLQFFEQTSCFYREMFMYPLWNKYPNYRQDIWDSLAIFLEGYAFERQGRRPDYFHAGVDALLWCRQQHKNQFTRNVVNDIWQRFSTLLNNQKLNHRNNPLYPSSNPNNITTIGNSPSIIEVVIRNNIHNSSFTNYIQNLITQNQDIKPAFDLVKSIRGIDKKIASFYLRDLADILTLNLTHVINRELLQPIDIWVERTIKILANNQQMSKQQIATYIVNYSNRYRINPERVNMGIWFFCSNVVMSEYRLNQVLSNLQSAQNLLSDFRRKIRNVCRRC